MSKFTDWQKAKSNTLAAKNWIENKNKIDSQGGKNYYLIASLSRESLQYHGQEYAGANNYHASSEAFNNAVVQVIKNESEMIFSKALEIMTEAEAKLAKESREEVVHMLSEIDGK